MARQYLNNYRTALTVAATDTDTTITVGTAPAALTPGDYYRLQVVDNADAPTKSEFVDVTAISGSDLTVTRAAEGSTAQTWDIGAVVRLTETAESFSGGSVAEHIAEPDPHTQYALEADLAAIATSGDSADASYDNTASGRAATDAQAAIDEAFTEIDRTALVQTVDDQSTINAKFFTGRYSLDNGDRTDSNDAANLFTIATNSPKWVQGPDGLLREVPAGSVAREWRNGVCVGAVVEPQSTRINLYPTQFDNPYWNKVSGDTVTQNATLAPNGTLTADKVISSTTSGYHGVRTIIVTQPGFYTASCCFKKSDYRYAWISDNAFSRYRIALDLDTGLITQSEGSASVNIYNHDIEQLPNGYFRLSVILESLSADLSIGFSFYGAPAGTAGTFGGAFYAGDGTSGVYVWGAQIEQGSKPTSLILGDEAAAVTRLADSITRTTGAEFNADEGTFVIEGEYIAGDTILSAGNYDVVAIGGKTKYALGYDTPITGNTITIGNGTHKTIKYLPRKLSADELTELEV